MLNQEEYSIVAVNCFGEKVARIVHKVRYYIHRHQQKTRDKDKIWWAPAPRDLPREHVDVKEALQQAAILAKEVDSRVFYALSKRSTRCYNMRRDLFE